MTITTKLQPSAADELSLPVRDGMRVHPWVFHAAIIALIFIMSFSLRAFNLEQSFDIFVDEITYTRISDNVYQKGSAELYGEPFYLHPPAFFVIEGAYLGLIDAPNDLIERIYAARYLNLFLASLTAVGLYLIGAHVARWPWGMAAAVLFTVDAFVIRMNSRNLLDTAALCWVVLGYAFLIYGINGDRRSFPLWRVLGVGFFFGLALLTKDMTAFLTVLPLAALFVLNWTIPRPVLVLVTLLTSVFYLIYPIVVAFSGNLDLLMEEKFGGLLRLVGLNKETGLNRGGGPSFLEKIIGKIGEFGMTYTLIGLGVIAVLILLKRGGRLARLVAVWTGGAYALLGYCIVIGTLEEQFFYFLIVPVILSIVLAAAVLFHFMRASRYRSLLYAGTALLTVAFGFLSTYEWMYRHFTPDNGYETVMNYLGQTMDPMGQVAATSGTAQFLLGNYAGGPWGSWSSVEAIQQHEPEFVLVSYDQVQWDYGADAQPLLDWIAANGTPLFEFRSRTNHLALYQLALFTEPET